jgi:hypothetical protein
VTFAAGAYDPQSARGRRLIAHELAHVVQQRRGAGVAGERSAASAEGATEARMQSEAARLRPRIPEWFDLEAMASQDVGLNPLGGGGT